MNPNFARKIDFWVGVPISLIISICQKIEELFSSKYSVNEATPRKIIFLELSEMGSAILAYSAVMKAKEMYPDAKLYFWIFKENVESVIISGIIPKENVIQIDSRSLFTLIIDTIKSLRMVRKERIDTLIDLELFSRFTSMLVYFSKAKKRAGFHKFSMEGLSRADVYSHKVTYNPYMHISKNFLSLVYSLRESGRETPLLKKSLGSEITEVPKRLPDNGQKQGIWAKLKATNSKVREGSKLVIFNFGIGDCLPLRNWPFENYLQLAEKLTKEDNVFVVLIGIKYALKQKEQIARLSTSERCIDLIGKTSVNELIGLCGISQLLISHDSGVANLASLTSINSIILFGPETPVLYAPLNPNGTVIYKNFACSPCLLAYNHRNSVCRNNLCIKAISVDEVYESAKKHL